MKVQWMILAFAMAATMVVQADSSRADSNRQIAETLGTIDGAVAYCVSVDPSDTRKFHALRRDLVQKVHAMSDRDRDDIGKTAAYRTAFKAVQNVIRSKYAKDAPTYCAIVAKSL
jgi:hypothetical protein